MKFKTGLLYTKVGRCNHPIHHQNPISRRYIYTLFQYTALFRVIRILALLGCDLYTSIDAGAVNQGDVVIHNYSHYCLELYEHLQRIDEYGASVNFHNENNRRESL